MSAALRPAPQWRWPAAFAVVVALHGAAVLMLQRVPPALPPDHPRMR